MRRRISILVLWLAPGVVWAQEEPPPEPPPEPVVEPQPEPDPVEPIEDPSVTADRAAAESLLRVGKDLMDLGQYEEAASKLLQSLRAHPSAEAALFLAETQDKRGLVASAWAAYRQAASMLRHAQDPRHEDAQARALALEPKVPRMTIAAVKTVPGMEILHGDTRFDDGVLGVALAVDPGKQRIVVKAPGYEPWSTEVQIRASERKTVTIPALSPVAQGEAPVGEPLVHGPWWTVGLVTGGVGLGCLGAGALVGAIAAAHVSTAEDDPALCGSDRICTPAGREKIDQASREAVAATVLLSVGGAAVVAGFLMVLFDEPRRETVVALPWVGPDGGGLGVGGHF